MSVSTPTNASAASQQSSLTASEPVHQFPRPQSISLNLPHIIHTTLHIQLNRLETSSMTFLTSSDPSSSSTASALGSFVYAMPNRFQPTEPLCTTLYSVQGTIDFAMRIAKVITRRTVKPAYVGCSVVFPAASVEEEMEALKTAVEGIMTLLKEGKD